MTFPAKNIVNNDLIGQMILADSTVLLERERENRLYFPVSPFFKPSSASVSDAEEGFFV